MIAPLAKFIDWSALQMAHMDHVMNLSHKLRLVILLVVLGCTAGCDQTSKHIARSKLSQGGFISLPGGFGELRLAENPGSFLSLGASLPNPLRRFIFTFGVAVGLFSMLAYLVLVGRFSWCSFIEKKVQSYECSRMAPLFFK
jgi:hypothetical protein